jgi:hypothetical protein
MTVLTRDPITANESELLALRKIEGVLGSSELREEDSQSASGLMRSKQERETRLVE